MDEFFLADKTLQSMSECFLPRDGRGSKKFKAELEWKAVHDELFTENGLEWPPEDMVEIEGMYRREQELVHLSNHAFPATVVGKWECFDANHSADRALSLNVKKAAGSNEKTTGPGWKSPWKDYVPTNTSKSSIACRKLCPDGSIILKRLHPIEKFRLNLWDTCQWNFSKMEAGSACDLTDLDDLAGNMWSLFHFTPLFITSMGAVNWDEVRAERQKKTDRAEVDSSEESASLSD